MENFLKTCRLRYLERKVEACPKEKPFINHAKRAVIDG